MDMRIEVGVCNDFIIALQGSISEKCEMNVAVVIVVVLVIVAWFIGYLFLQKVEERKEKTKNSVNHKRRTFAIP